MSKNNPRRFDHRLRGVLAAGLAAFSLTLADPAWSQTGPDAVAAADGAVPGEILLRLRSTAALTPLLQRHGLRLVAQFGARPIYRVGIIGTGDAGRVIEALRLDPTVILVDRNVLHRSPEARRNSAWAIGSAAAWQTQWAPAALRLAQAHALSRGAGVRVAVLDTGIDAAHPLFAGRLLPGADFVDGDLDSAEVGHPATHPSFGHGTHVAGLVALAAPAARIMPLRVLDAAGTGNAWVLAEAMLHAVDPDRNPATPDGAQVINMSLGSLGRTRLLDTIGTLAGCSIPDLIVDPEDDYSDPGYGDDKARCATVGGAVVVAAAGNDGSASLRQYPAAEGFYGLLAVTATAADSRLASFANSGNWIDLAAPGEGITSAVPGGGYGTWSGTSMAAPLAAGVAALLRAQDPALSPQELTRRLMRRSGAVCGARLRSLDAFAALGGGPAASLCR